MAIRLNPAHASTNPKRSIETFRIFDPFRLSYALPENGEPMRTRKNEQRRTTVSPTMDDTTQSISGLGALSGKHGAVVGA